MSFGISVAQLRIETVALFFHVYRQVDRSKKLYTTSVATELKFRCGFQPWTNLSAKDSYMRYGVYDFVDFYKMFGHILSENCVE